MTVRIHNVEDTKIAEIISDGIIIGCTEDILDLIGTLYSEEADKVILHGENLSPGFFDLKTGIAGDILQKISTYRIRLAIVGDFSKYTGKSIRDFIFESNKGKHVNFVSTVDKAVEALSRQ